MLRRRRHFAVPTTVWALAAIQDAGRITLTLDTRIAQFVAGKHEAYFGGGVDYAVCRALAAG